MTRNRKYAAIALTLAALALAGCAGSSTTAKSSQDKTGLSQVMTGKVAETMDGGGYTYILLDQSGKKTWVAIPASKLTVGQEVKLLPGAEMPGFSSKALNRTFDMIIFSGGLYKEQDAAAAKDAAKPAAKPDKKDLTADGFPKPVLAGKVVETMQAGNYTYILLEKDGKKGWAAIPASEVKVGQELELIPGVDMGTFKSTSLKRTFENIHFSAGIKGAEGKATPKMPEGHPKTDAAPGAPAAGAGDLPMPPGHPKIDKAAAAGGQAPAAPAAAPAGISGKVVETVDAGGYTYVQLQKGSEKTWVAFPAAQVKVGQELSLPAGNVMTNFTSKSLNRTFEKIIFTNGPN